jgi:glycosyltransferase involved in cell wall biosynthesis
LDQTISGYEVIVSDDCSTDGTWERILALAEQDARIKPVRTPQNYGMPGNANFAIAQSNRPYIALLHHDDIYRNDLLEKWAGVLERHHDVGFVFNPYGVFQSSYIQSVSIPGERVDGRWFLEKFLFPGWGCAVRGTAMIRRKAWDDLGEMREQFSLLADVDMWMRLAMHWAVGYVPEPVVIVRQQRPSYYPEIYRGGSWSWVRQRILYEIHAVNRQAYFKLNQRHRKFTWWVFRLRLSKETIKWLVYALLRRKPSMIATSYEGATNYDLWALRVFRWVLQRAISAEKSISSRSGMTSFKSISNR